MPHSGDNGNFRIINSPCHPLIVEGPQVLDGPAAPPGDDHVRHPAAVGVAQGSHDFRRGLRPLDPDGQQLHLCQRIPAAQDTDHIVDRRSGGGSDNGDCLRVLGQRLLAALLEKPLLPQLFLQLFKGHVEVPHAIRAEGLAVELVGPVPGVDADAAHGDDFHAVFRPEAEAEGLSFKHHAAEGAFGVLQCKIMVAGGIELIV